MRQFVVYPPRHTQMKPERQGCSDLWTHRQTSDGPFTLEGRLLTFTWHHATKFRFRFAGALMLRYLYNFALPGGRRVVVVYYPAEREAKRTPRPARDPDLSNAPFDAALAALGMHAGIRPNVTSHDAPDRVRHRRR